MEVDQLLVFYIKKLNLSYHHKLQIGRALDLNPFRIYFLFCFIYLIQHPILNSWKNYCTSVLYKKRINTCQSKTLLKSLCVIYYLF